MGVGLEEGAEAAAPPSASRHRAARVTLTSVVAVALVGVLGFAVGRATDHERARSVRCSSPFVPDSSGRSGVALPNGKLGWFVPCEEDAEAVAAIREHRLAHPVKVYASKRGNQVVAWWYVDCDLDQGMVAPGAAHPACDSTGTTAPG